MSYELPDSPALRVVQAAQNQYAAALQQWKHEQNERRDNMLNEQELVALLDTYTETGR